MTPAAPCLRHWRGWVGAAEADGWLRALLKEVPWKQEHVTVFGRRHPMPRLTCWMADPGCGYRYAGLENTIEPWTPLAAAIRRRVAAAADRDFNSLLLNLYRDGRDAMGWHADDEPELGPEPVIASLSLGAVRGFAFRDVAERRQRLKLELPHGSLLLMGGRAQALYQHAIAKSARAMPPRLNLTFRWIHCRSAA